MTSKRGICVLRIVGRRHTIIGRPKKGADAAAAVWIRAEARIAVRVVLVARAQLEWRKVQGVGTWWGRILMHAVGQGSRNKLCGCLQQRAPDADAALVATELGTTILEPDLQLVSNYRLRYVL